MYMDFRISLTQKLKNGFDCLVGIQIVYNVGYFLSQQSRGTITELHTGEPKLKASRVLFVEITPRKTNKKRLMKQKHGQPNN